MIDQKSISGYVFQMANGPISWQSKKQPTVALSSITAALNTSTYSIISYAKNSSLTRCNSSTAQWMTTWPTYSPRPYQSQNTTIWSNGWEWRRSRGGVLSAEQREPNTATPTLYLAQPNKERSGAHCRLFSYRLSLSLVYNGQ
jgi:hypothetical protein